MAEKAKNDKVRLVSIHDVLTKREAESDPTLCKEPRIKKIARKAKAHRS